MGSPISGLPNLFPEFEMFEIYILFASGNRQSTPSKDSRMLTTLSASVICINRWSWKPFSNLKPQCSLQVVTSYILSHTHTVSLIKEWASGRIGFHLTDCPWRQLWYQILFMGRAGVHCIDRPDRHIHYLLRGAAADMSTEVWSFGKRVSALSFFVAARSLSSLAVK